MGLFPTILIAVLMFMPLDPSEYGQFEQPPEIPDEVVSDVVVEDPSGYQIQPPIYPNVVLWGGLHPGDDGACPLVDGYGWGGASWPVPSRKIKENRLFMVTQMHRGIDIEADIGTPVTAASGGTVIWAGKQMTGYGQLAAIAHGGGYQTIYAHLSQVAVTCGQNVSQGEVIGYSGQTGLATWPHLHFEIRINGLNYDPLQWLSDYIIIPKTLPAEGNNETAADLLDRVKGGNS